RLVVNELARGSPKEAPQDPPRSTGPEANRSEVPGSTVSGVMRAPTAVATAAPQNARPDDSGLMMSGSPGDRNIRTQDGFEPGVRVHAQVDKRSNSARFEPWSVWVHT